jgi:hypothetical protein
VWWRVLGLNLHGIETQHGAASIEFHAGSHGVHGEAGSRDNLCRTLRSTRLGCGITAEPSIAQQVQQCQQFDNTQGDFLALINL